MLANGLDHRHDNLRVVAPEPRTWSRLKAAPCAESNVSVRGVLDTQNHLTRAVALENNLAVNRRQGKKRMEKSGGRRLEEGVGGWDGKKGGMVCRVFGGSKRIVKSQNNIMLAISSTTFTMRQCQHSRRKVSNSELLRAAYGIGCANRRARPLVSLHADGADGNRRRAQQHSHLYKKQFTWQRDGSVLWAGFRSEGLSDRVTGQER